MWRTVYQDGCNGFFITSSGFVASLVLFSWTFLLLYHRHYRDMATDQPFGASESWTPSEAWSTTSNVSILHLR